MCKWGQYAFIQKSVAYTIQQDGMLVILLYPGNIKYGSFKCTGGSCTSHSRRSIAFNVNMFL